MRYPRVIIALVGVLMLSMTLATAGDAPQLAPGTRVRVELSTAEKRLVGKLLGLDDRNLKLQVEDETGPRIFLREDIEALAVSGGRHSRGRRALVVGGIGLAAGAVIGYAAGEDPDSECLDGFERQDTTLAGAVLLGSIGALIGLAISPGERWEDVPLENVRLSVGPVPGRGVGVLLSVGF